jgi:hypothetical protein
MKRKHTLIIHNQWAIGDVVCLSALVRDLQLAYPNTYDVQISGHYRNVFWRNSPYATVAPEKPTGQLVKLDYQDGIAESNAGRRVHFLTWFHESIRRKLGICVPVTLPKGDIHLTAEERRPTVNGPYWLVFAGGKKDMTAKVWSASYWQRTVDELLRQGIRCVQAGGDFADHFNPTLTNVENMVAKTRDQRAFFSLVANAEGVICGITSAMHLAAVFDKPCVVIAGGREPWWWESYTNEGQWPASCRPVRVPHRFLHTMGRIECGLGNLNRGCWRTRTVAVTLDDVTKPKAKDKLCRRPVTIEQQAVPECLKMIKPDDVVGAVLSYYSDGTLSRSGLRTPVALPVVGNAWNDSWTKQLPKQVEPRAAEPIDMALMDHPYVGGKFTIGVLGYGDHLDLLERCLESIARTLPKHRRDIRLALNQPSRRVKEYAESFAEVRGITAIYTDAGTRKKYPAMRTMFWDDAHPIETPYVLWFDDDSWCRRQDWALMLTQSILANHRTGGRLYGARYWHDLAGIKREGAPRDKWFRDSIWWRGKNLYTASGARTAPNGSQIVFASGGFWALATHVIREADIPDRRLNHNGGDVTIGCQVTQAGYKVVDFSPRPKKEIIAWSDSPRRGYSEQFPWA